MKQFLRYSKIISIIILCFFIFGCTGYKKYDLSAGTNWAQRHQQENTPIQVDKFVKIQTTDGKEFLGFINSVSETGFKINEQQIDYSSIETVQAREFLWAPTLTIAAISAFTVLLFSIEPGVFSTTD